MHGRGVLKQLRPVEQILQDGQWIHGVFQADALKSDNDATFRPEGEARIECSGPDATDTAISSTDNNFGTSHKTGKEDLNVTDSMAQLSLTFSASDDDAEGRDLKRVAQHADRPLPLCADNGATNAAQI
jgi:hypothetical protein